MTVRAPDISHATRAATKQSMGERFMVLNRTDGVFVHPVAVTLSSALRLVRQFPRRFERQGYYLTAAGKRIRPQDVSLSIVPAGSALAPLPLDEGPETEPGVPCGAEISAWVKYKAEKIRALNERGYKVYSVSPADQWLRLVVPRGGFLHGPEAAAVVQFDSRPSESGLQGGKILKLNISRVREATPGCFMPGEVLFRFDGKRSADRLKKCAEAKKLYDELVEVLD